MNVNKATAEDLASSLGLAQPEAEAIVKYRGEKGNFKTWQDVAAVPGVPAAKIEGMQKRHVHLPKAVGDAFSDRILRAVKLRLFSLDHCRSIAFPLI